MIYNIMDVNRDGEIIARIASNNGKNALKRFRRERCFSAGIYEIKKGRFNWAMLTSYGVAFYAMPDRRAQNV